VQLIRPCVPSCEWRHDDKIEIRRIDLLNGVEAHSPVIKWDLDGGESDGPGSDQFTRKSSSLYQVSSLTGAIKR
jgi:hypothetical protein